MHLEQTLRDYLMLQGIVFAATAVAKHMIILCAAPLLYWLTEEGEIDKRACLLTVKGLEQCIGEIHLPWSTLLGIQQSLLHLVLEHAGQCMQARLVGHAYPALSHRLVLWMHHKGGASD